MKRAFAALPKGEELLLPAENVIDDDRKANVFGLMMSLNMLIETGTGFDYTCADFNRWARQVRVQLYLAAVSSSGRPGALLPLSNTTLLINSSVRQNA